MKNIIVSTVLALAPVFALAQTPDFGWVTGSGASILGLISGFLVPLVIAVAVLVFLWGVFKAFILGGSDEGKRKEGRQLMLWGIIALVVMGALWGVVELVINLFGLDGADGSVNVPNPVPR